MAYGNTIKLTFNTSSKLFPMTKPVVTFQIGGRNVSEAVPMIREVAPNKWEATFKLNFGDHRTGTDSSYNATTEAAERNVNFGGIDGLVSFTITGIGEDGNAIAPVSSTGDGSSVTFDKTLPSIPDPPVVSPTANNADPYWDDDMYDYIEKTVLDNVPFFLEAPGLPEFRITDAKYAGLTRTVAERNSSGTATTNRTDYTAVFKAAIAEAHAVGTGAKVIVPPGTYYTGAIHLLSNVNLVVEEGATIMFLRIITQEFYPIVLQQFEGQDIYNYSPPIYALKQENIAITGKGTLNAQFTNGWSLRMGDKMALNRDSDRGVPVVNRIYTDSATNNPTATMPATIPVIDGDEVKWIAPPATAVNNRIGLRPCFVVPYACENIIIRDVSLRGTPMWNVVPTCSKNILVDGLNINAVGIGNGDGVNPMASEFIIIQGVDFSNGDDCIAIKSYKNGDGLRRSQPSQYIIIRDCMFRDGHGGVTCGSEISGGIRWVFAEDNAFQSSNLQYALRFKMNSFRGATIENIYERNSTISRSTTACLYIESSYTSGNAQDGYGDIGRYTPHINNVYISNFTTPTGANIGCTNFVRMTAYTRAPINGIHIKDCTFRGVGASTVESLSNWELINVGTTTSANFSGTPTIVNSIPMKVTGVTISDTAGTRSVGLKDTITYGNNNVAVLRRSGTGYTVTGKVETASASTPTVRIYTSTSKTAYTTATVTPAAGGGYNFTGNVTLSATEDCYFVNVTAWNGAQAASNLNQTTAVHNLVLTDKVSIPTLVGNVNITSDSGYQIGNANRMAYGNTIKLTFNTSSKLFPMTKPVVTFQIGGRNVSEAVPMVKEVAPNKWEATFKLNFGDHRTGTDSSYNATTEVAERNVNFGGIDGLVSFTITGIGEDGNAITPVSSTGDGSSVTFDKTLPSIPDPPVVSPTANNADPYWDDDMYDFIEKTVLDNVPFFLEAPGLPEFRITDAKYAGLTRTVAERNSSGTATTNRTDYTAVFKAAIADAHAVGTGAKVIVPPGTYYTGAIHLLSNVNLLVEEGATVMFLRIITQEFYPIVLQQFEGQDIYNYSPPIYALKQENIAITGKGTLNAQFTNGWSLRMGDKMALNRDSDRGVPVVNRIYTDSATNNPTATMPATIPVIDGDEVKWIAPPATAVNNRIGLRPCFVVPYACENIIIRDVSLRGTPMWNVVPTCSKNILVDGLNINAVGIGNGDGVNPMSSEFIIIQGVDFSNGDDCIAIKSFKNGDGLRKSQPSQYIIIRDCMFRDGHGGVTCGSEISGGIRWVFAEDNAFQSSNLQYALRFKMNSFRGATIENIYERNSTISRSTTACLYIESSYTSGNAQDGYGDIGRYTPHINNVYISNFTTPAGANIGCTNFVRMTAYTRAPINGIHIKDSTFRGVGNSTVESLVNWELVNVGTTTSANYSGTPTIVNSIPMKVTGVTISDTAGDRTVGLKDTIAYGNNNVAVMRRNGTGYTIRGKVETASADTPTVRIYTSTSKTAYTTATVTPAAGGGYNFTGNVTLAATEDCYFINITAWNGAQAAANLNQTTAVHNLVLTAERPDTLEIAKIGNDVIATFWNGTVLERDIYLIIAEYDDAGKLVAVEQEVVAVGPMNKGVVSLPASENSFKAFAWDPDTYVPLLAAAVLN